jgi:hypothetical protein
MASTLPTITEETPAPPNPNMVARSDANLPELAEAVGCLKVGSSSSSAHRLLKDSGNVAAEGVDSGYASKEGSQAPSLENTACIDGGTVVGSPRWSRRNKMKLIPFEKTIPKLTQNRFEDLRELHADNLIDLTRGVSRSRGILMSLKVLGESESTAAPWVFIQCDKAVAKKVRRFFKLPSVELDFKPPNPDAYTPSFEIYVYEMPPLALGGNSPNRPIPQHDYANETPELHLGEWSDESLCGSKITVSTHGQKRSATIGGVISIQSADRKTWVLGITAGHFLAEERYMDDLEEEQDSDDDLDGASFDDASEFELDLDPREFEVLLRSAEETAQREVPEWVLASVGGIFMASQDGLHDGPNLDWALFTIKDISFYLPNLLTVHQISQVIHPDRRDTHGENPVLLSTVTSGLVLGTLSSSWSYLMLAPGNGLVRTNTLKVPHHHGWHLYPTDQESC